MKLNVCILLAAMCLTMFLSGCRKAEGPGGSSAPHASAVGEAARGKAFVASVIRQPFHKPACQWAGKITTADLVGYDSREAAIADGHVPCKVCSP